MLLTYKYRLKAKRIMQLIVLKSVISNLKIVRKARVINLMSIRFKH